MQLLADQLRRSNARLLDAHYLDADTRVRHRLADLLEVYGGGEGPVTIPLTQEELAEMAGTSRATVNRVLREDERKGLLELRRGKTVITQVDAYARGATRR